MHENAYLFPSFTDKEKPNVLAIFKVIALVVIWEFDQSDTMARCAESTERGNDRTTHPIDFLPVNWTAMIAMP
jgi:hypothetical protein